MAYGVDFFFRFHLLWQNAGCRIDLVFNMSDDARLVLWKQTLTKTS